MNQSEEHTVKCVNARAGLPDEALDGGWTAAGMSAYAKKLEDAIAIAYGYLWHVNNEPGTPNQYAPDKAAHEAIKVLRDLMTYDQRGEGIRRARELMGHNAKLRCTQQREANDDK